jgi:hypothetical protein
LLVGGADLVVGDRFESLGGEGDMNAHGGIVA